MNKQLFNDVLCIYVIAAYPFQLVFFYEQISWNLGILQQTKYTLLHVAFTWACNN